MFRSRNFYVAILPNIVAEMTAVNFRGVVVWFIFNTIIHAFFRVA